jgi:nucleotide-binding universal stress UspA family protein
MESDHVRCRGRDDALRYLERISSRLGELNIASEIYVRGGSPAPVIVEIAAKAHAGFIAMIAQGRTTGERGLLGGTAERVLRLAPNGLLLVHASDDAPKGHPVRIERILVALEGTELSESILMYAMQLARWHASKLLLAGGRSFGNVKRAQTNRMEELCERLGHLGVQATYTWVEELRSSELLRLAEDKHVGMIALNSRRRNGFTRLLSGNVAEDIAREANVPVYLTCNRRLVKLSTDATSEAAEPALA